MLRLNLYYLNFTLIIWVKKAHISYFLFKHFDLRELSTYFLIIAFVSVDIAIKNITLFPFNFKNNTIGIPAQYVIFFSFPPPPKKKINFGLPQIFFTAT